MQHSSDSNNQDHLVRGPQSTRGRGRVRGRGNRGHPQQGRGRGKGRGRGRGRGQGRGGSTRGRNGSGGGASSVAGDDLQWSETTNTVNVERFTENVGPAVPISAHIVDIFRLFFTTSLIDLIVEQTNLYASQLMETAQYEKWTKVTADEIWAYFGYVILMGINRLPALADYWKLDPTYRYRPIADKITRNRIMEIIRYTYNHIRKCYPEQLKSRAKSGLENRGEYRYAKNGNLLVSLCQDTKTVFCLSVSF